VGLSAQARPHVAFDDIYEHVTVHLVDLPNQDPSFASALASQFGVDGWFLPSFDLILNRADRTGGSGNAWHRDGVEIVSIRDKSFDLVTSNYDTYSKGPASGAITLHGYMGYMTVYIILYLPPMEICCFNATYLGVSLKSN